MCTSRGISSPSGNCHELLVLCILAFSRAIKGHHWGPHTLTLWPDSQLQDAHGFSSSPCLLESSLKTSRMWPYCPWQPCLLLARLGVDSKCKIEPKLWEDSSKILQSSFPIFDGFLMKTFKMILIRASYIYIFLLYDSNMYFTECFETQTT